MRCTRNISQISVYAGCLFFAFFLFFIVPVFMNSQREMFFPRYLPAITPIGGDYRIVFNFISKWIAGENLTGLRALNCPPFSWLIYLPMLLVSLQTGYVLCVCLTLICFTGVIVWTARHSGENKKEALPLVLIPGLMSYGLQFELERGQFNVVAIALTVVSIAMYHVGSEKWRIPTTWLSFFLFSCAIQMKLFPACFVFLFTRDARAWRRNIVRWGGLGCANIALLLALGWDNFMRFWSSLKCLQGSYAGRAGVSIQSFAGLVQKMVDDSFSTVSLAGVNADGLDVARSWVPNVLRYHFGDIVCAVGMLLAIGCFAIILLVAWQKNNRRIWALLMMGCVLIGLLVLGNSYAYRLSVLPMVLVWFLKESDDFRLGSWRERLRLCLGILFYFGYCACLFPYAYVPVFLQSTVPVLLIMLIAVAGMAALDENTVPASESGS